MHKKSLICLFLISIVTNAPVMATTYLLPDNPDDSVIFDLSDGFLYATAKEEDTLLDVARRYDIGQNEILLLNKEVDRWLPGAGTQVRLPNFRVLPKTSKTGLILNLPEYRMYYYPPARKNSSKIVITHPISIGRQDWNTPLGITKIIRKTKNPSWIPPESIKKEHAEQGDPLPDVVPAGEDNPLGLYKMTLGIPGYLIHSTNKPYGVGMRVSHGCVRMYPEDIEQLFPEVDIGLPVHIVNQPIKVGWLNNAMYIEVHPELEEKNADYDNQLSNALDLITQANNDQMPLIDGAILKKALKEQNGIPVIISLPSFEE